MHYTTAEQIAEWCSQHLGASPIGDPLFTTAQLSQVLGLRLADGREIVIKARPDEPRIAGCTHVQQHMFAAGYPCPQVLAGPLPLRAELAWTATAEVYVAGGEILSSGPHLAQRHANALADLVRLAPDRALVGPLDPAPPWVRWDHDRAGIWAPRDDGSDSINAHHIPDWLTDVGRFVRDRLRRDTSRLIVGPDGRHHVVYDWDSAAIRSEAVIVGAAAAVYTACGRQLTDATVEQADALLDAYQSATGRPFSKADRQPAGPRGCGSAPTTPSATIKTAYPASSPRKPRNDCSTPAPKQSRQIKSLPPHDSAGGSFPSRLSNRAGQTQGRTQHRDAVPQDRGGDRRPLTGGPGAPLGPLRRGADVHAGRCHIALAGGNDGDSRPSVSHG